MIIHRDYTSSSDSIVKVFNDHILFFNPGGLPDSITIEQLLTNNYVSTPRNRQIAKIVKEMGWIEKYGTGIKRVRNMFVEYGLKQPLFESIPGGFAATVFARNDNVTDNVTDNRIDTLLNLINKNNKITTQKLADILGVSRMTIARDIECLKEKGMLERVGPDKGGFWKIIK